MQLTLRHGPTALHLCILNGYRLLIDLVYDNAYINVQNNLIITSLAGVCRHIITIDNMNN